MRPAKTHNSQHIDPIWSESSLSAWRNRGSITSYWAQRRLIRLGGCPGWSESSLGIQVILFVLLCYTYSSKARCNEVSLLSMNRCLKFSNASDSFNVFCIASEITVTVNPKISYQFLTNLYIVLVCSGLISGSTIFSVILRRCLVATGSSMLTFIVLPHWSIMPQTLDKLTWYHTSHTILTLGQPVLALPVSLSAKRGAASSIFLTT